MKQRLLGCLVGVLVFGLATASAWGSPFEDSFIQVEDAAERAAKADADMRKLVERRFPSVDDLGEGWRRPWELTQGIPRAFRSEDQFWASVKPAPAWAQFYGMSAEQVEQAVRDSMEKVMAMVRSEPIPPGFPDNMVKVLTKPEGILSTQLFQLRLFNLTSYESQMAIAAKNQSVTMAFLRDKFDMMQRHQEERNNPGGESQQAIFERHRTEQQAQSFDQFLMFWDAMCSDLKGADFDQMVKAYVDEARAIRQLGGMVYVYADPDEVRKANDDPKYFPKYGKVTVELRVLSREAIDTKIQDLPLEQMSETEKQIGSLFSEMMKMIKEMGSLQIESQVEQIDAQISQANDSRHQAQNRRNAAQSDWDRKGADRSIAQAEGTIERLNKERERLMDNKSQLQSLPAVKLEVQPRDYGDHSWVALLDIPPMQGMKLEAFHARLRNGNAVVNIKADGSMPREWFLEQLDYFLAAMDERTQVFIED